MLNQLFCQLCCSRKSTAEINGSRPPSSLGDADRLAATFTRFQADLSRTSKELSAVRKELKLARSGSAADATRRCRAGGSTKDGSRGASLTTVYDDMDWDMATGGEQAGQQEEEEELPLANRKGGTSATAPWARKRTIRFEDEDEEERAAQDTEGQDPGAEDLEAEEPEVAAKDVTPPVRRGTLGARKKTGASAEEARSD